MARREFETLTPQMYYILLVLKQPKHGYDIMNEVSQLTKGQVQIGAGTLYTLLPRFEEEGYITLVKEEKKRKIYQLTQIGMTKLHKENERMLQQIQYFQELYEEEDL